MKKNQGFTILELVISLIIGGMISASALAVLFAGQRVNTHHDAVVTAQQSISNGLDLLMDSIRKSGEYEYLRRRSATLEGAGIVTTATNYGYGLTVPKIALSQAGSGPTYTNVRSDQLVVKYTPKNTKGLDCEGSPITSTSIEVVERWFVRPSDEGVDLSLACDAGRFNGSVITGLGDAGVEIIPNVDQFSIRLSTMILQPSQFLNFANTSFLGGTRYSDMTLDMFALSTNMSIIKAVNIALVVHSSQPHSSETARVVNYQYGGWAPVLFGSQVVLNSGANTAAKQYLQSAVFRTVTLFNPFS